MKQRVKIKFCFKTGKTATETSQLMKQACGDNALSSTRISEWYAAVLSNVFIYWGASD
jgi:hypothetical protein